MLQLCNSLRIELQNFWIAKQGPHTWEPRCEVILVYTTLNYQIIPNYPKLALALPLILLVIGLEDRVTLDDIGDRVNKIVQYEIETEQARRFLRNVLRVDGAAMLTDGVSKIHQ